jgi:hypothetical protein
MNNQCQQEDNTMIFQFLQASNIDISYYFLKMASYFRENLRDELDYQNMTVKELSPLQKKILADIEQMNIAELRALSDFIDSLKLYKKEVTCKAE